MQICYEIILSPDGHRLPELNSDVPRYEAFIRCRSEAGPFRPDL